MRAPFALAELNLTNLNPNPEPKKERQCWPPNESQTQTTQLKALISNQS
jgi:hypothetical protein